MMFVQVILFCWVVAYYAALTLESEVEDSNETN